jgi:hypothetical protein
LKGQIVTAEEPEELDWMPLGEDYTPEDGALLPVTAFRPGAAAKVGEDKFYEIWPSEPPDHLDDHFTHEASSPGDPARHKRLRRPGRLVAETHGSSGCKSSDPAQEPVIPHTAMFWR